MSEDSSLAKYQRYLEDNYDGGCERFFSPTGFLERFQRTVEVHAAAARQVVVASGIEDAVKKLAPAIEGTDGVWDLSSEAGTGKTSVLPFKFAESRVVVALPTPFDAWSAYCMATGPCMLKIKGLKLGSATRVVYTDSYMAAAMVLSGRDEYDVMIVDECDSDRGVTKCLAEVKVPGKTLLRMSATHGKFGTVNAKGFQVTTVDDMPDVRNGVKPVADYVLKNRAKRSMVLMPDAVTAAELAALVPESILVSTSSGLATLGRALVDQHSDVTYIADDACARGLNLNLDVLFDSQLVTEYGVARVVTTAEAHQRKNRVGRNKSGWYRSPALKLAKVAMLSDVDAVRHNVVRVLAGLPQLGESSLWVTEAEADQLMCAHREPKELLLKSRELAQYQVVDVASDSSSSAGDSRSTFRSRTSSSSSRRSSKGVKVPAWFSWVAGGGGTVVSRRDSSGAFSDETGLVCSSSERSVSYASRSVMREYLEGAVVAHRAAPALPVDNKAPYAAGALAPLAGRVAVVKPVAPPVMDLNQLEQAMDWPALLADRHAAGGDLPTIVPPGSWRHTSSVGLGTDWQRRLQDLAVKDLTFDDAEFEIVCRAWNRLAAQCWVRRTPGLAPRSERDSVEFCLRYFQGAFLLGMS